MVLGMWNVFQNPSQKNGKRMGMTSQTIDLWRKFKMAAKTAVKINKSIILALVWSRVLCNTIFSMFYGMANMFPGVILMLPIFVEVRGKK